MKIAAHVGAMDELWPYSDNFFDLIVDDTASMSIGYERGIFVCREEMRRVLKPGRYVVIYSLANDDPFLLRFSLGEERNTVVTPDGKIERVYTPEELQKFYAVFRLIHQEKRSLYSNTGGGWERRTIWTLLQKPA